MTWPDLRVIHFLIKWPIRTFYSSTTIKYWPPSISWRLSGVDPGFQVRGVVHLKKLRWAEEGVKIFGVYRVKNHDFTPKNHIFSNCGGRRENFWGILCEKSRFYAKKSYLFQLRREARKLLGYFVWKITILRQKFLFFPMLGGRAPGAPPLDPPLDNFV